jgi:uncharacterized protein (UPF0332 family)
VATWAELSEDCLVVAQKLFNEGHLRSSISRSYYAAYSAISEKLVGRGVSFAHGWNNLSHDQLLMLVRNGLRLSTQNRRQVERSIRRLRVARENADYRPGITVDRPLALACIFDALGIARILESTND